MTPIPLLLSELNMTVSTPLSRETIFNDDDHICFQQNHFDAIKAIRGSDPKYTAPS